MEEKNKMQTYQVLFGSHIPFRLAIERELCSRPSRLIEGDSSNLLLENSCNRLGKIEFNDYMNRELISWQSSRPKQKHLWIFGGK